MMVGENNNIQSSNPRGSQGRASNYQALSRGKMGQKGSEISGDVEVTSISMVEPCDIIDLYIFI